MPRSPYSRICSWSDNRTHESSQFSVGGENRILLLTSHVTKVNTFRKRRDLQRLAEDETFSNSPASVSQKEKPVRKQSQSDYDVLYL